MIANETKIRPRYGEVDRMGYVYHANYVDYCHVARTELLRTVGIHDHFLEDHELFFPVVSFHINYRRPAYYDEWLVIKTTLEEIPSLKFLFHYEVRNDKDDIVSNATSVLVLVDKQTRKPLPVPAYIKEMLIKKNNSHEKS